MIKIFGNFSNQFTEQELLRFLNKTENVHPKNFNLLQINTEINSQMELLPNMTTRETTANRPITHNTDEKRSFQSMITEDIVA